MKLTVLFILIGTIATAQTTIYDIQYSTNGASPLVGQTLTTYGVVSASIQPGDLGAVHIQQPGLTEWAGLRLRGGAALFALQRGDLIEVTGTVVEDNGLTVLDNVSQVIKVDSGLTVTPVQVAPGLFSTYDVTDTEKYESMLVELSLAPDSVLVVDVNPDLPNNFGDYRIGADTANHDNGCRVLAGRVTSTQFSSLNVSYINDLAWESNSGSMNVPGVEVQQGWAFQWVRGIMTYGFGEMRLLPRNNADFAPLFVSIQENPGNEALHWTVYPNPASTVIELRGSFTAAATMELSDLRGRSVRAAQSVQKDGVHMVYINDLPSGIYLITIYERELSTTARLIVN